MAYQVRHRDPLFDSTTQAVIERRGKELLGLGLLTAALMIAMILGSYSQDDPSWLSATEEPAANLLGRFGASIAQPTYIIVGWGGWGLSLIFAVWGLRFLFHLGEDRALSRAIFAPIGVALGSVYAATHVPTRLVDPFLRAGRPVRRHGAGRDPEHRAGRSRLRAQGDGGAAGGGNVVFGGCSCWASPRPS